MNSTVKRVLSVLLTVCMLLSVVPTAFATPAALTDVKSSAELESALASGKELIRITADFEIDRTFYVSGNTTIYSDIDRTLTRSPEFGGDVFVVGEKAGAASEALAGKPAHLTLGRKDASGMLVIDGNKQNMTVDVTGTVIFICNSSDVDIYDGITVKNSHKSKNQKTYGTAYALSYPERIGGAAVIVATGTLNIYGGVITGNSVNDEDTSENAPADARDSSQGGAIYNYGNLNVYGGVIENNVGARGGAIYNYRTARFDGGIIRNNCSYSHGGAVYQAGSQYANVIFGYVGDDVGDRMVFENNTAGTGGGAIYAYTQSSILGYGNVTFRGNNAKTAAGGAICCYGSLTLKNAVFEHNTSATRGGALYVSNADETLTARLNTVEGCVFDGNSSVSGGGAALFSGDSAMSEGATVFFTGCTFTDNKADTENGDNYGGAIYVHRKSNAIIKDTAFNKNFAKTEGGAIYISGESNTTLDGSAMSENTSEAGGAISVRSSVLSITATAFDKNSADKNGGGIYVSYVGDSAVNTVLTLENALFDGNSAVKYGGAIYATEHKTEKDARVLTSLGSEFIENRAQKGGAIYVTAGTDAYFENGKFDKNSAVSDSADNEDINGGAIYATESTLKVDGTAFSENTSAYNGGGIGAYSGSSVITNNVTASGNVAGNAGGFLYNSGSDVKIYNGTLSKNSATEKTGGALSLHSKGTTAVYNSLFDSNSAKTHGGAVYVYPGDTLTVLQDNEFKNNSAKSYGGAVYISNASKLDLYNTLATGNSAKNGGVLYVTTTDTEVKLIGMTVSGNSAQDGGPIIWGNTTKAKLSINKESFSDDDTDGALDDSYWSSAIANKLTVTENTDTLTAYPPFEAEPKPEIVTPPAKTPVPVSDVFTLAKSSSNGEIDATYAAFKKLDNSSNFMSRGEATFDNINGSTVTVDSLAYHANKPDNNPNVAQGILIYQAMLYKQAHPEKDVSIDVSSFHFSIEAAVCINRDSRYFGYMRALADKDYDEYGFVRIAYLLVTAAKMGIDVTVIGQLEGYPRSAASPLYTQYFLSHLDDPCDSAYTEGVVGDYLDYNHCEWTSYGDNSATDMMHVKMCAVSNYIDMHGKEHGGTVWTASVNIDGISPNGVNGNNLMQAGVVISDHEAIYRVSSNYIDLMAEYNGQEDIYHFRETVIQRNTEQTDLILAGKGGDIPKDEQIIYLGTESDDVFELYFAPFGGERVVWDDVYNPYCKYINDLAASEGPIVFVWNNVKYDDFAFGQQIANAVANAFRNNKSLENKLYVVAGKFNYSIFDDLEVGKDIGYKSLGRFHFGGIHSKDIQMSYVKDGQRYYVSFLNSLNMHGGSMSYQTNQVIVIKEKDCSGDSVFFDVANQTTKGIVPMSLDSSKVFSDVENKWYKAAVDYNYTNGFISGMSNTEFGINTPVTRGMFITVLARMAGVDTSKSANSWALSRFNDVHVGRYYSAAVKWASESGIVAGVTETEFMPDSPISRQQLCVMITNYAKYMGMPLRVVETQTAFADSADIQNYAKAAVTACQSADIVNGYSEGGKLIFKPSATATRAEAAQILYKFHTS